MSNNDYQILSDNYQNLVDNGFWAKYQIGDTVKLIDHIPAKKAFFYELYDRLGNGEGYLTVFENQKEMNKAIAISLTGMRKSNIKPARMLLIENYDNTKEIFYI
jgi:hypothetical protein